jgi:hypothetical protein
VFSAALFPILSSKISFIFYSNYLIDLCPCNSEVIPLFIFMDITLAVGSVY